MKEISLKNIYNGYVKKYQQSGVKPYPDRLLALLLLPEKDRYLPLRVTEGKFYQYYQKEIDAKIKQIENDFDITKEDMIRYIEEKGICYQEEVYEEDKIWFVYAEGFGVMHGSLMYEPDATPEQVYQSSLCCFHEEKMNKDIHKKVKRRNESEY